MIIILLGQTAVGKSAMALELAKEADGEIISADSMQVYRGMDIGTAKPSGEEQKAVPHHLIDIRNPDESWTVKDFVEETNKLIPEIQKRKHLPIIVGGTGFYLWSLLEGYSFPDLETDPDLRKELNRRSAEELHEELSKIDPESAKNIHPNNKKRVIRALEVFRLTGAPISRRREPEHEFPVPKPGNSRINSTVSQVIGLALPREKLYERINKRVDQMIEKGLVEEVKSLLEKGYKKDLPALSALGYKEIIKHLEGEISLGEAVALIKKNTRNFAKRQMTWFKKFKTVTWLDENLTKQKHRIMLK